MRHLTPDELVDSVDAGEAAPAAFRSHLEICAACRAQRDALIAVLTDARMVTLPEPSPLFWDRLSDRVRLEIEADPVDANSSWSWLRWPVLVPLSGLAAIVLVLALGKVMLVRGGGGNQHRREDREELTHKARDRIAQAKA